MTLGLDLADADIDRLLAHLGLMERWGRVYNLSAVRGAQEMLSHHLLDCLAVVPALRRHAADRPLRVLDVGSGGGLPGVVLAVLHPSWQVTCVDAVAKKAAFIRQVGLELGLGNLVSAHARVEDLPASAPFDLITSRAFASLADFVSLTAPLLAAGGVWAAMKGRVSLDELSACGPTAEVFHVEHLEVPGLDAQRCIVWMRPRTG
ncbi:16S rRNA (guanine(527)-N(7))-methyltransferase RsmG [Ideonella sp. A 288]|uniref:16S rRNA (guanine(527)-N(7))-methyltransferase RsmG n=1 Tax=Ideonella sp. A 288 TaxID=1962181 RepID=UPI001F2E3A7F|nr:16S rRNA (guanine(527)-N(7))-methyltransferase RsmG [Ideonella sp. A 288]